MNTFVIGDVHGCFYTLKNLVKKLPHNAEIIFVGDLCDRGKYSKEVIEFVIENNYPSIKGNHENYIINHLEDVIFNNEEENIDWLKKGWGGSATVNSYKKEDKELISKHIKWLKALPSFLFIDNLYFITHGYGLPYFKRKEIDDEKIRHALMSNRIDNNKYKSSWEDTTTYEVINVFVRLMKSWLEKITTVLILVALMGINLQL